MKKSMKAALVLGTCAVASMVASSIIAAGSVQATKDDCMSAWAILLASHPAIHSAFPHVEYKQAVQGVIRNKGQHWTCNVEGCAAQGEYQPGFSQKFTLSTFDTRFYEGGTAYVAHCGHGATCNELSREVLKAYPELGSIPVYCTAEAPHILENPAGW